MLESQLKALKEFIDNGPSLSKREKKILDSYQLSDETIYLRVCYFHIYENTPVKFEMSEASNSGDYEIAPMPYAWVIKAGKGSTSKGFAIKEGDFVKLRDHKTKLFENPLFKAVASKNVNATYALETPPPLTTNFFDFHARDIAVIDPAKKMDICDYFTISIHPSELECVIKDPKVLL